MRRGQGIAALKKQQELKDKAQQLGQQIQNQQLQEMKNQLVEFKSYLEEFAHKHKKEINDNPLFRKEFMQMCKEIGVDPLSSTQKTGFMSKLFDNRINDFYYELAIQITNICIALRPKNGGYLEEKECLRLLNKLRGKYAQKVELEDISKALISLEKLSSDFKIIQTGDKRVIVSSSVDFNSDQMTILNAAEANGGWITFSDLRNKQPTFNSQQRFKDAIDLLIMDGLGWEDEEPFLDAHSQVGKYTKDVQDQGLVYWFPTLMKDQDQQINLDDEKLLDFKS